MARIERDRPAPGSPEELAIRERVRTGAAPPKPPEPDAEKLLEQAKGNRFGKGEKKGPLGNGSREGFQRLVVGNLPRELHGVKKEANAYRRQLEDAVLKMKGEIDLADAHVIDAAAQATMAAGIARWMLREKIEQMSIADLLKVNREILVAKKDRSKLVKELGLDAPPPNPWEEIEVEDINDDSA